MKLATLTILVSVLGGGFALAAEPMNETQCQKLWVAAVQSNDSLSATGAADGQVSSSEFSEGCKKGLVHEPR
jgi:hypothetical protein